MLVVHCVQSEIEKERAVGITNDYSKSKVILQTTESLDQLGKTAMELTGGKKRVDASTDDASVAAHH